MNFAGFVDGRTRSILFVALALAAAGLIAARTLPLRLIPQVAFPRVVVDLNAGSRPAGQTALLVTRPVEEAIRSVPGVLGCFAPPVRAVRRRSREVSAGMDNMVGGTLLIDAAISQILADLGSGTGYSVRRMDPAGFPIVSYALVLDVLCRGSRCRIWRSHFPLSVVDPWLGPGQRPGRRDRGVENARRPLPPCQLRPGRDGRGSCRGEGAMCCRRCRPRQTMHKLLSGDGRSQHWHERQNRRRGVALRRRRSSG